MILNSNNVELITDKDFFSLFHFSKATSLDTFCCNNNDKHLPGTEYVVVDLNYVCFKS